MSDDTKIKTNMRLTNSDAQAQDMASVPASASHVRALYVTRTVLKIEALVFRNGHTSARAFIFQVFSLPLCNFSLNLYLTLSVALGANL